MIDTFRGFACPKLDIFNGIIKSIKIYGREKKVTNRLFLFIIFAQFSKFQVANRWQWTFMDNHGQLWTKQWVAFWLLSKEFRLFLLRLTNSNRVWKSVCSKFDSWKSCKRSENSGPSGLRVKSALSPKGSSAPEGASDPKGTTAINGLRDVWRHLVITKN